MCSKICGSIVLFCTLLKQNTAFTRKHEHISTRHATEEAAREASASVPWAGPGRWAAAARIHQRRGWRAVIVTCRGIRLFRELGQSSKSRSSWTTVQDACGGCRHRGVIVARAECGWCTVLCTGIVGTWRARQASAWTWRARAAQAVLELSPGGCRHVSLESDSGSQCSVCTISKRQEICSARRRRRQPWP